MRWSDPATWGGALPPPNAVVIIPAGKTIILDGSTGPLKGLHIRGSLIAGDQDLSITSDYVSVEGGRLAIGTADRPYTARASITLTGSSPTDAGAPAGFGNKVLAVLGGSLELHGRPSTKSWTKLGADVAVGARSITLSEATGWRAGDEIVLSPSTGNQADYSVATIESIDGTRITLKEPLKKSHIGRTHKAGDLSFDFRSEVGLLTQNIVIQGDASSASSKLGGHAMFMAGSTGATVQIANVQWQRMGQLNQLGRYPIHFHVMGNGCNNCYVRNSTVRDTVQRGIVVHDSAGISVVGNVVFNTVGHNIVVETPTTGGNRIEGNLALINDMPKPDHTEPTLMTQNDHLPGNYWIKSAKNVFLGNIAAGSLSNGFIFDSVNNGPVVFRANVGRNSMAQGRVGDFNFGSGILLLFNRATHPEDDWSDNVVFHNQQGFWPENEPDDPAADQGFVIRRLTAVENGMNVVNRGVGMRINYEDTVIGGSISKQTVNRGFHNQYGSVVSAKNPIFVNIAGLTSATDIATPEHSTFRISGGRFIGPRSDSVDDTSINTFVDDQLMPRGTYVAVEQQSLVANDCVRSSIAEGGFALCAMERKVGELHVRASNSWTTPLSAMQDILRSDGVRYRLVGRPGANSLNGVHGYAVLLDREFSYSIDPPSAPGIAIRLDPGMYPITTTLTVSVPMNAAPRSVSRTTSDFDPVTSGGTAMRAVTSLEALSANPVGSYFFDSAAQRLWVKAMSQWIIINR